MWDSTRKRLKIFKNLSLVSPCNFSYSGAFSRFLYSICNNCWNTLSANFYFYLLSEIMKLTALPTGARTKAYGSLQGSLYGFRFNSLALGVRSSVKCANLYKDRLHLGVLYRSSTYYTYLCSLISTAPFHSDSCSFIDLIW